MLRPTRSSELLTPRSISSPTLLIPLAILHRVPNAWVQILFALASSIFALVCIIILFAGSVSDTVAAPNPRPMAEIITGTSSITHTSKTTHEMHVFANGQLSNRF